jgi:hypothetical protein
MYWDGPGAMSFAKPVLARQKTSPWASAGRDYFSLVDRRWRDFIHWISATSA